MDEVGKPDFGLDAGGISGIMGLTARYIIIENHDRVGCGLSVKKLDR